MYTLLSTDGYGLTGLDVEKQPEITVDSIIQSLKLDTWEARKIPNFREDAVEVGKSYMIRRLNNDPINDPDNHDVVLKPYIGEKYTVLQYPDGLRWLDPFLMEQLLTVNTVFYVEPGSTLCVTSDIGVEAEVVAGDTVRRYFIFVLSHDGSTRMLGYCDTCPVCCNTLAIAKAEAFSKAGKALTLDDENPEKSLEYARRTIDLVKQQFTETALPFYGAYAALELENQQIDNIFRTVINAPLKADPKAFSDQLYDRYHALKTAFNESPGQELRGTNTGWAVLGAVSNASKHLGDTSFKQYKNEMFGSGRIMRRQTMELLDSLLPETSIPVAAGR